MQLASAAMPWGSPGRPIASRTPTPRIRSHFVSQHVGVSVPVPVCQGGDRSFLSGVRPLLCSVACYATRAKVSKRRKSLPTLKQLREKLKELGLPSSGKKADLLETLRQAVLEAKEELEPEACPPVKGAAAATAEDVVDTETSRIRSSWQALSPSLEDDVNLIRPGDRIFLRAHTGCYIEVAEEMAFARWDDTGDWQRLVIEKSPLVVEDTDPSLFHPGDLMFLKAHTGRYLDVQDEGSPVQARWQDLGVWQGLELAKKDKDPLREGDILFLKSHTGMYIDVHNHQVQARWADEGDWQALTISRS